MEAKEVFLVETSDRSDWAQLVEHTWTGIEVEYRSGRITRAIWWQYHDERLRDQWPDGIPWADAIEQLRSDPYAWIYHPDSKGINDPPWPS